MTVPLPLATVFNPLPPAVNKWIADHLLPKVKTDTLYVGSTLEPGESLHSQDGKYELRMKPDGDLELTADSRRVWSSETAVPTGGKLVGAQVDADGSLKVFAVVNGTKTALFSLPLGYSNGHHVTLTDAGRMTLFDRDDQLLASDLLGADVGPHFMLVVIHPPDGASRGLIAAVNAMREWCQLTLDLCGHPAEIKSFKKELLRRGLPVDTQSAKTISEYNAKLQRIEEYKREMRAANDKIGDIAGQATELVSRTRNDINNDINSLKEFLKNVKMWSNASPVIAAALAADKKDHNSPALSAATESIILQKMFVTAESIENRIKGVTEWVAKVEPEVTPTTTIPSDGGSGGGGNGGGNGSGGDTGGTSSTGLGGGSGDLFGTGLDGLSGTGLDGLSGTGLDGLSGTGPGGYQVGAGDDPNASRVSRLLDRVEQDLANNMSANPSRSAAGAADGLAQQMMLSQLASSMMNRNSPVNRMDRPTPRQDDPPRDDSAPTSPSPAPSMPQDTPPAAPPADTIATAAPPADSGPPSPPPSNKPVDMKLPDGTTQKTSSVVAEAVQKEWNNPNGGNAQDAYAGTPGQKSPENWLQIGPEEVDTGDVVTWGERSAVVVEKEGSLYLVAHQKLLKLDDVNNPPDDGHGAYGDFVAYFRPVGAQLDKSGDADTAAASPAMAPSAGPPPAVPARADRSQA
ncbi:hypothetical protein [Nocardia iowensis]|uniref:Bulb-type lectin domain-containing protein n=1 Tax=Nocardia iowensis TaxID=204891 RepID=A0ABX8S0Q4_NOCIO|nr:hypothetical protein [Nocardia iowensis]QXN94667.1 hypothetical protein KV110_17395 [Nocardia iowensis]